jgi:hypothetical protein
MPAKCVQRERVLERKLELVSRACYRHFDPPEGSELLAAATVEASRLARRLRLVDRRPAGVEIEQRRFRSFDHMSAAGELLDESAAGGNSEEVREVRPRGCRAFGEGGGCGGALAVCKEEIR